MKGTGFLQEIISSIVSQTRFHGETSSEYSIEQLCEILLSNNGEGTIKRTGSAILSNYLAMDEEEKQSFFYHLCENYDLDTAAILEAADTYGKDKTAENLKTLLKQAEPPRQELLRRLNRIPGATEMVVLMRADLLKHLKKNPGLKRLDLDFEHLLVSWFNLGFLTLRPISWKSPANVLAKIIKYEAVHAINDWNDLRRRLEPADRRCFAFFHPTMPDEPLVFVEIALCQGIPTSIQSVLDENRKVLKETEADTAVFYSISNCQAGLRGVSFGNSLIKQVATDLSTELPKLKNFVTLSPIPGLRSWVENHPDELPVQIAEKLLGMDSDALINSEIADDLKKVAANYLLKAKRQDGAPIDPVARFHLGNGASAHQLHASADISERGQNQSFSVMVNYRYDMDKTEINHEDFATNGTVHVSKEIQLLASKKFSKHLECENVG